ncbi:MAG: hypothetical protein KAT05_17890 [Spirochaetes bacterium]|nr:hypothetical protein [Spirochaetota bacterium]
MSYLLMEREFDRVFKKAVPYLIFSPNGIRDNVADYMKSLWMALRNTNQSDFDSMCFKINDIISNSDDHIDSFLQYNISDFNERRIGIDESISKIKKELIDIRKEIRTIKNNGVEIKTSVVSDDVEIKVSPSIKNTSNFVNKPNSQKCSCGSKLSHKKMNDVHRYYCFKSQGGCGKTYFMDEDGKLIDNVSRMKTLFCAACGEEIHKRGKLKSNGKVYQRYACKASTKGGCGKGYIMDEDGDLHFGMAFNSLSSPKVEMKS